MKSVPRVLILFGIACVSQVLDVAARELARPASGPVAVLNATESSRTVVADRTVDGIVTGFAGHFACRSFSGTARELAIAVSDVEPARVASLLRGGADINARADASYAHHRTLLQVAVLHDWGQKSIGLLIGAGAVVNARDDRGDTALTTACRNPEGANLAVVAQLIRAGAAVNGSGASGMTPLMCAALYDRTGGLVKTLLASAADVTARDKLGWTALMHATRRRREHMAIVDLLMRAGAQVNARHQGGGTALSNAAYNGHTQTAQLLIKAGADVNTRDSANWTPLICASLNGHYQIAKMLIEAGAHVNDTNKLGKTALNVARTRGHRLVVELLDQGAARE